MTERSLQELLLCIATGEQQRSRIHEGNAIVAQDDGKWARVKVRVESRPGEHPGLWEELETTIARLHKFGGSAGTGARSAESPMPYHHRASEVANQLGNAVITWARDLAETHEHLTLTATTVPAAARWLATFPGLLAEHPAVDEMYSDIHRVVKAAERVIDRAPDRTWAGPCYEPLTAEDEAKLAEDPDAEVARCKADLFARKGREFVVCRGCGAEHAVADRREWIARALGTLLVTAAEAAPVLSWLLDKDIKAATIWNWKRHSRLTVHPGPRPFLFSELEKLAREVRTRNTGPRAKAAPREGSSAA